ncbi:MAG: class II aldolase/adducin family protein [Desulfocapsaceae bacterium]|jgi:L-fuculose-phosphate aldolase/L-ribulose-5-phosphate 4-epimerase|nr:class II aldolase/adducin family protein [Desulfocapsaceae bacterium]
MNKVSDIQKDMIKTALRAYQIGLQSGNGGNLSCRVPGTDTVIIKGSGLSFGECSQDNFVVVNMKGEVTGDGGKPSRELLTHLCIYRLRPDILGIFHTHSPWSIACADGTDEIPLLTGHSRSKLGPVPVLREQTQATADFAETVENLLTKKPRIAAFVQSGHGIFALGSTIIEAEHHAELVEETAQIALLISLKTR